MGLDTTGDVAVSDAQAASGAGVDCAPLPSHSNTVGHNSGVSTDRNAILEDVRKTAMEDVDAKLGLLGLGSQCTDRDAILEEVRKSVLEDVDAKLADKMKELWSRGNKMLKQIEQDNQKQNA